MFWLLAVFGSLHVIRAQCTQSSCTEQCFPSKLYILRWSVYISVACEPRPLFIQTCGKEICATFIVKYQHGEHQQSNVGLVYPILQSDRHCSHHRCNGTRLRATGINWDQHGNRQLWQMECQGVWSINPDLYRATISIVVHMFHMQLSAHQKVTVGVYQHHHQTSWDLAVEMEFPY